MHEQKNLFDRPFEFEIGSRHISYDVATVTIQGRTFDLHDLSATLKSVDRHDSMVVNVEMCRLLKELDVLKYCGSRRYLWPASTGSRFQEFKDMVEDLSAGLDDEQEDEL